MKLLSFPVLFVLLTSFVHPQAKEGEVSGQSLYQRAVSACVAKQLSDYGTQNEETRSRLTKRLFLKDQILTEKLPAEFKEIKVQYVGVDELLALYKEKKKRARKTDRIEIPFTIVRPMKNEGSTLIVSLSDYWFSYKKKTYQYALEGGCNAHFNFETKSGQLALTKTDLWGV